MNRTMLFILGGLAVGILIVATPFSNSPSNAAEGAGLDGKAVFLEQKCNMCHAVPAAGIEAKVKPGPMKGPDMTSAVTAVGADQLGKFLRKQEQLDGKDHKKEFTGTDEELKAILAWLAGLK